MTILKINDIIRALTKKGFRLIESGKHKRFVYFYKGLPSNIRTHYSHSCEEIDDFLICKMAEQIKISKTNFIRLIECSMTSEDYLKEVKEIVDKSSKNKENI